MKRAFVFAALLALAGSAMGQVDTVWTREYYNQENNASLRGCAVAQDSFIYVTGEYKEGTTNGIKLIKYNSNGDTIWSRFYTRPSYALDVNHLCMDSTNGVYLFGKKYVGGEDWLSVKYNIDGDTVWSKTHSIAGQARGCRYKNGYLYIAGESGANTYLTVKILSASDGQDITTFLYPFNLSFGQDCIVDDSGNTYVTGNYLNGTDYDVLTIKFNALGETTWVKRYHGPTGEDVGYSCVIGNNNDLYVFGQSTISSTSVLMLIKYDTQTGDSIWVKTYNMHAQQWGRCLTFDKDGYLYGTGGCNEGTGNSMGLTVKFNTNGDTIWSKTCEDSSSFEAIDIDNLKFIYAGGKKKVDGYDNFYLVKYHQQSNVDTSLVAHYLFSGNARDTSGYGNHGIPQNGVTLTMDRFGQPNSAYQFDGVNDYITVPHNSLFNFTTEYTFTFWMKPLAATQTFDAGLIAKGTGNTEVYCVDFTEVNGDNLRLFSWAGGAPYVLSNPGWLDSSKVGKWYQVIARYRGPIQTGELFINGQLLNSSTFPSMLDTNTDEIAFGGQRTVIYDKFFNGCLDDIRMYNRALSDAEVLALYEAERPYVLQPPQLIYPPDNAHLSVDTVHFIWHASDSAASYRIQVCRDDSTFNLTLYNEPVADTTWSWPIAAYERWYWRVRAYTAGNTDSSAWSPIRSLYVDRDAPWAPNLVSPADNAWVPGGTTLWWKESSGGADFYRVQVSADTNFTNIADSMTMEDTFRLLPALPEGKYFWRVAASDSAWNWSIFTNPWRFRLDTTHVRMQSTWPVAGQSNVMFEDTVRISFSEPVVISSFDYTCNPDPGGWHLTVSPNRDTFKLDHAPFDTATAYTFTVIAASDSAGNGLAAGLVNNPWTFTTTADGVGPALRHTPVSSAVDSGVAIPLTAYATDPGSGVQTVILYYRQGGREEFTEAAMAHPSDSTYQAQIPASEVSARGVSYYLRAVDNLGAQTFSPNGAPAFRHQPRVSLDNVVYGSTLSGGSYRMFAFPFETAGPPWRPSQLADDLGAYDATVWRLFRWQSGAYAEYEAVQDIIPGRAYWIINRNGGTFDLADGRTVADSASHIPLASGWNMVGAPFNYPVNLSDVRVYAGPQGFDFLDTANTLTERRLVDYDGSGYANKTRMDQWHGYWVRALTGGVTMMVPAASATDKSAPISDPEGWTLSLEASCGGYHDRDNRVGITPRGARDNASEPPAVGAGVSLGIDKDGQRLAEDYRQEIGRGQCWRFTVDCGVPGTVELAWREEGERGWQYAVYDVTAGRPVTGGNCRWQPGGEARQFAVLAGSPEFIASEAYRAGLVPSTTLLERIWPNPFIQFTNIKYQLSRPGLARITVYNVLGQKVRTLVDEAKAPGRYEIAWDGRDGSGRRAGAGVYFCRMEADGVCATVRMALLR